VASYTSWEPPEEADDEKPILADAEDTTLPLPRYTIEGEERPTPAARPERAARGERSPAEGRSRAPAPGDVGEPPGFVQLFVNVGKREGVTPGDLQKVLADKGLAEAEAGRVRVRDRMSFISVKKEALERAVAALTGEVFGGRTVVAELARGRG
jgi:ATP-dependent RNA helicase DeaD